MQKIFLFIAPLSMLALAACNQSETPAADTAAPDQATNTVAAGPPTKLPPSITASATYRCADNTILYVDFLGENEAADIRVGDKTATAVRVTPPEVAMPAEGDAAKAEANPAAPMKSADGKTSLLGSGKQINVQLADKRAQSCKSN
jgi:hypothetical protein